MDISEDDKENDKENAPIEVQKTEKIKVKNHNNLFYPAPPPCH